MRQFCQRQRVGKNAYPPSYGIFIGRLMKDSPANSLVWKQWAEYKWLKHIFSQYEYKYNIDAPF